MTHSSLKAWRERLSWTKTKAAEALGLENREHAAQLQRISDQKVQWCRFIAERGTRQERQRRV